MSTVRKVVGRDRYLDRLMRSRWNGMVKIVSGVRGCGKSFLLFGLFRDRLISEGVPEDRIIGIALSDAAHPELLDGRTLYEHISARMAEDGDHYILLDDIHLVSGSESLLNTLLRLGNADIYVTSGRARPLCSGVGTGFRGRDWKIRLHPLSFGEFASVYDGPEEEALEEYLVFGGMPAIIGIEDPKEKMAVLEGLTRDACPWDVEGAGHIGDGRGPGDAFGLICSTVGSPTDPHRMAGRSAGGMTDSRISGCIGDLEDAFLFERARRYYVKGRRHLGSPFKIYPADTGLLDARMYPERPDPSVLAEVVIYNELRSRGFSVDIGVVRERVTVDGVRFSRSHTIDFMANMGSRRYYVQSAYGMNPDEMAVRIRPLLRTGDSFRKILVIGGDREPMYDDNGVMIVGIRRFLKDESLMQN